MSGARIVRSILAELNARPRTKAIKVHGSAYMEIGTPDILGCDENGMIAIEVKAPGKKIKPGGIQEKRLAEWAAAGARTGVATTVDEATEIVDKKTAAGALKRSTAACQRSGEMTAMTKDRVQGDAAVGKRQEWLDSALRMADNMALAVERAAKPDDLQRVGQRLANADEWRRSYEFARQKMRELSDD